MLTITIYEPVSELMSTFRNCHDPLLPPSSSAFNAWIVILDSDDIIASPKWGPRTVLHTEYICMRPQQQDFAEFLPGNPSKKPGRKLNIPNLLNLVKVHERIVS